MQSLRWINLILLFLGVLATSRGQTAGLQTAGARIRKPLLLDELEATEGGPELRAPQHQRRTMIDDRRILSRPLQSRSQLIRTALFEKELSYNLIGNREDNENFGIMDRSRVLSRSVQISGDFKNAQGVALDSRWQLFGHDPLQTEMKTRVRRETQNTTLRRRKRYIWPFLALSWLYSPYFYSGLYGYSALYSPVYYRYPYYTYSYGYGYYPYRWVINPVYVNPVQPTGATTTPAAAR